MEQAGEVKFTTKNIPQIVNLFKKADADGSGGLDLEEFCDGLKEAFQTEYKEDLIHLFYKIDANCDGTVDLFELVEFLICSKETARNLVPKDVFPKSIKVTTMNHYWTIAQVIFLPFDDSKESEFGISIQMEEKRTYQSGKYIAISYDGVLTYLSDRMDVLSGIQLDVKEEALPFSSNKKMHVTGMAHIPELEQMAVSTCEREVLFYSCNEITQLFLISHALILEDSSASAITYGCNNDKSVLAFGDGEGFLTVLTAHNIQDNNFFRAEMFEKKTQRYYKAVYVSNLIKNKTKHCHCVKIPIFNDICTQIQYFPFTDSLATCGSSSKKMVVVTLPNELKDKLNKEVFESAREKQFFNCVDYSPLTGYLLTGGKDGLLREWFPFNTKSCIRSLAGHVKPITHITVNSKDQLVISLSEDKNVRVWSEEKMLPLQSFQVRDMGNCRITSMCYNTYNNELVLANTQIGAYLGKGTDVYQKALKSHDMPICGALYHSIYKQVISVCQDGVVKVSDILTGDAAVQFNVTSDKHVGHTAIALDGPQRRLITGSPDGKVRLWNFSNGKSLAVHPVTLPNGVKDLVCLNERVFVSLLNSKIIYDLDMDGKKNRFLKHDYLNDISSMDVHKSTLISASSNGNIIIWKTKPAEVFIWINGSKSAKTVWMGASVQGQTGPIEEQTKKSGNTTIVKAQHIIKSLKTREVSSSTATLLSATDGYICAWSVHIKGGLLGKFKAVEEKGVVITTMSTDENEKILLTGDSNGKICQWDIHQFGFANQSNGGPYGEQYGWRWSLAQPPLLASWQCYADDVVSIHCDNSCRKLITAGLDCYIHLWENTGSHIGVFGKDKWNAEHLDLEKHWEEGNERLAITPTRKTEKSEDDSKLSTSKDDFSKQYQSTSPKPAGSNLFFEKFDNFASPHVELSKKERVVTPVCLFRPFPYPGNIIRVKYPVLPTKKRKALLDDFIQKNSLNRVKWVSVFHSKPVPSPPSSEKMQLKPLPLPKKTTIKYGREFQIQQNVAFKDSNLRSCVKNDLPSKQKTKPTSQHVRLLPKRDVVEPRNHQTQLTPQPLDTQHISDGADQTQINQLPPHTEHVSDGADQTQINQLPPQASTYIKSTEGGWVKNRQRAASGNSVLILCPPRLRPGHHRIHPTPHPPNTSELGLGAVEDPEAAATQSHLHEHQATTLKAELKHWFPNKISTQMETTHRRIW
ncbi:WD repeat-containing protein on Y chromosome-like isoform 1-T1 [Spinachia spinachia]